MVAIQIWFYVHPSKRGKKLPILTFAIFFQEGLKPNNCFAKIHWASFHLGSCFFGGFQRGPGTDFHFFTTGGDATCFVSKTFFSKKLGKMRETVVSKYQGHWGFPQPPWGGTNLSHMNLFKVNMACSEGQDFWHFLLGMVKKVVFKT